jgi:hypothetical protein
LRDDITYPTNNKPVQNEQALHIAACFNSACADLSAAFKQGDVDDRVLLLIARQYLSAIPSLTVRQGISDLSLYEEAMQKAAVCSRLARGFEAGIFSESTELEQIKAADGAILKKWTHY